MDGLGRYRRIAALALSTLAASTLVVAAAQAASSPSGAWAFDEAAGAAATDSVGGLNGTITGATRIAGGAFGKALSFDGGDSVTIPDAPAIRSPDLSVTVWVRGDPESPPADGAVILEKGDLDCAGGAYALIVDGTHVALRYRDVEVGEVRTVALGGASAFPTLWDGEWHQVGFSTKTDQWGFAGLWIEGWLVGSSSRGIQQTGLDTSALVIGSDAADCGEPGFSGDIDHLRVYGRTINGTEFAADEPVGHPTLTIESVDALTNEEDGQVHVRIQPTPVRPGSIHIYLTAPGAAEIEGPGPMRIESWWSLPADGRFTVPVFPKHGGSHTIRLRYEPAWGADDAEATTVVDVARAASTTAVGVPDHDRTGEPIAIAGEPITVHAGTKTEYAIVPTGTIQLYEIVDDVPHLLASGALQHDDGMGWSASRPFTLPARDAGVVVVEARYLGSGDIEPSASQRYTFTVEPALVPGSVTLNGGAATTDDHIVTVATGAQGAIAMQLASDLVDIRRQDPPIDYAPTATMWLTAPWYGDDADGVRSIWVRWADALGRWSAWSSDSIVLDRGVPAGSVTINGGASLAVSRTVTVAAPIDDPALVDAVELSNDGVTWTEAPYATSIAWNIAGDGTRTVRVRWRDLQGRQSVTKTDSIVVDSLAPVVASPKAAVQAGSRPGVSIPTRFSWSAKDASAIASYDVAIRKDGGSWTTIANGTKATTTTRSLAPGAGYELRVRATDVRGHRSAWKVGHVVRAKAYQESSTRLTFGGTWTRATAAAYWGDALRYAKRSGATATLRVTARAIAWVAPVGPSRGSARVYVDGVYVGTVSLYAPTSGSARVVFQRSWASAAARTVTIKVSGTSGHPRVDVDGFAVLQ